MKALDTPVLLSVLSGEPSARALLRRLRGIEIATTELNLLELGNLAFSGSDRHRGARLASLDRLRRRLTVLPIDSASTREAISRATKSGLSTLQPTLLGMLGALEACGADELFTDDPKQIPGKWRFKVSKFNSALRK